MKTHFIPDSNDISSLTPEEAKLGKLLEEAFHDKQNPQRIKELVEAQAPVNYRLNYALEIKLEADFVACLRLLMKGDQGEETLLDSARILKSNEEEAKNLVNYVSTAQIIYDILYTEYANNKLVPLNKEFSEYLKTYAAESRFDPCSENGSLIIAAGIRDEELIKEIIAIGKESEVSEDKNGATIDFRGYFGETAAAWSAIMLDQANLEILLNNGSPFGALGMTGSTLLHWVVVAARLDNSIERQERARNVANMLIERGADPHITNKLGSSAFDYAQGKMKEILSPNPLHTKVTATPVLENTKGRSL